MITTRTLLTSLIFTSMAACLVGMNALPQEDTSTHKEQASPKIKPALQAQPPAKKVAESTPIKAPAVALPAKKVTRLVKIYALKNLAAPTAKKLLGALTANSDQLRMEVDLLGNSIIASGTKEQHSFIESALNEIDQLLIAKEADTNTKPDKDEPQFLPYARDARPAEIWLHKMLQTPVPELDFPGETPLAEILEQIATYYTTTHGASDGPLLKFTILPDILELELESINSLEDVLIRDIELEGQTLENSLQIILEQTDPRLTYEIRNEVMFITTEVKAADSLHTRVYEVEHLLSVAIERRIAPIIAPYLGGPQAWGTGVGGGNGNGSGGGGGGLRGGSGMGGGGGGFFSVQFGGQSAGGMHPNSGQGNNTETQPAPEPSSKKKKRNRKGSRRTQVQISYIDVYSLIQTIQSVTSPPCNWVDIDGEGGTITPIGNTLVIHQTQPGHQRIVRLLNLLTEATQKSAE